MQQIHRRALFFDYYFSPSHTHPVFKRLRTSNLVVFDQLFYLPIFLKNRDVLMFAKIYASDMFSQTDVKFQVILKIGAV